METFYRERKETAAKKKCPLHWESVVDCRKLICKYLLQRENPGLLTDLQIICYCYKPSIGNQGSLVNSIFLEHFRLQYKKVASR